MKRLAYLAIPALSSKFPSCCEKTSDYSSEPALDLSFSNYESGRIIFRKVLHPVAFGGLLSILYLMALLPGLRHAHYDFSVFVDAGDLLVNENALDAPIIVRKHSAGYDGEFYYRLAVDPWPTSDARHGVKFDSVASRAQQILYPVLAWIASLGQAELVPVALVLVNIAAVGLVGAASMCVVNAAGLPLWIPFAIAIWPGFVVTVTHDTTELVPQVFVLFALWAWASGRLWLFSLFAALAPLAREIAVFVPAGFFVWSVVAWSRRERSAIRLRQVLACGVALLPCLLWREALALMFQAPLAASSDIGWPGVGWLHTIERIIVPQSYPILRPLTGDLGRRMALATLASAAFIITVAMNLVPASRCKSLAPATLAWASTAILMTLLTAGGPWVEDIAIFRAFTECYVLGVIVLGMAGGGWRIAVPTFCIAGLLTRMMWSSALNHINF